MDLRDDWFGRSSEGFTYKSSTRALEWENYVKTGNPYSTFLGKFTPKKDSVAHITALNIIDTVKKAMLGKRAGRIAVKLGEDQSYTDITSLVVVAADSMKHPKVPTFNHALDIMLGGAVHEFAHCKFTPPNEVEEFVKKHKKYKNPLFFRLCNLIEDERINKKVGDYYTGYANYLASSKKFMFSTKYDKVEQTGDVLTDFYNALITLIRYPSAIEDEVVDKFGDILQDVRLILTPYPETHSSVLKRASEIYDLLDIPELPEQSGNGEGESEEDENSEKEEGEGSGGSENSDKEEDGEDNEEDENSEGSGDDPEDEEDNNGENGSDKDEDKETDDENEDNGDGDDEDSEEGEEETVAVKLEKIAKDDEDTDDLSGEENEEPKTIEVDQDDDKVESFRPLKRFVEPGDLMPVYFDTKTPYKNRTTYEADSAEVGLFASTLAKKLGYLYKDDIFTQRGLKSGELDEDELADFVAGSPFIYKHDYEDKSKGGAVVLLLDHSGSTSHNNLYINIRKIAVLFDLALKAVPDIDFYCYSHGTHYLDDVNDYSYNGYDYTVVMPYVENQKVFAHKIGSYRYHNAANRDGQALMFVADRVLTLTDKPITIFMVNDGDPASNFLPSGYDNISYTKECVEKVEEMNIDVIQVAVEEAVSSEEMFSKWVKFTDFGSMVQKTGELLYKLIKDKQ